MNLTDFGERLSAWLDERDMTAEALSQQAGVSAASVSNWKAGALPQMKQAHKCLLVLGLSVEDFFGPTPTESKMAWQSLRSTPEKPL